MKTILGYPVIESPYVPEGELRTLMRDHILKLWAEIQRPTVVVSQYLEWDSYLIDAHRDMIGRWEPRTLVMGRRVANYLKWLDAWRDAWFLKPRGGQE